MSPNPAVLTWPRPVAAGAGGFSFVGHASAPLKANVTNITIPLGEPASDRVIIVAVTSQYGSSVAGNAINGTTWTDDVYLRATSETTGNIFHYAISTGTTATLTYVTTSNAGRIGVGVWRATGGTVSLIDTDTGNASDFTVATGDLVVSSRYGAADTTWSGVTEQYDSVYAVATGRYTGGSIVATAAGTVSPRASGGLSLTQVSAVYRLS